jgi:hypothetical protein
MSDPHRPSDDELAALAEGAGEEGALLDAVARSPEDLELVRAALDETAAQAAGEDAEEATRARRAALVEGAAGLVPSAAASSPAVQRITSLPAPARAEAEGPTVSNRNALGGLLAMAAALLLGLTIMGPSGGSDDWTPAPLQVRITRDMPASGSAREAEQAGLGAYADGDYGRAGDQLLLALERGGRAELAIHAASAALLGGVDDPSALAQHGERLGLLADGTQGVVRAEALWQLLALHRTLGNRAGARAVAQRLVADEPAGPRTDEARVFLGDRAP